MKGGWFCVHNSRTISAPKWCKCSSIEMKKGAQIKSYLISHALITAGFKI